MATKAVDATQLDGDLTSVANAVRQKGGTSAALSFPAGFVSAVQAIPTGITPTGTKNITANGTYDVTNFASAAVNVQGGGVPLPATITPGDTPVMLASITDMNNGYVYGTTIKEIPGLSLTIKKAGTYRFITSADTYAVNSAYIIYLYKNGVSVAQQSAPSSGNNYNMRLQADVACNVGDVITVRAKARGSTNYTHSDCWLAACINWDNSF